MKNRILLISFAVLFIGTISFLFSGSNQNDFESFVVKKGDMYREVFSTGSVKATEEIGLSFELGGLISEIYVNEGSRVVAGQEIARLDYGGLLSQINSAEAVLEMEKIALLELERGITDEKRNVAAAEVQRAEIASQNSGRALIRKIEESQSEVNYVMATYAENFFSNQDGSFGVTFKDPATNTQYYFNTLDFSLKNRLKLERVAILDEIDNWGDILNKVDDSFDHQNLVLVAGVSLNNLEKMRQFLSDLSVAVSDFNTDKLFLLPRIESYKQMISTAQATINGSIAGLEASLQNYKLSFSSLDLAKKQYEQMVAGTTGEQIDLQRARISQAEANLRVVKNQASQKTIKAPVSGKVLLKSANKGEVVQMGQRVFTLFPEEDFQIEINVYEGDIGLINLNDLAEVSIVAFPGRVFSGRVFFIESTPSFVDGVVHYKVKLSLDGEIPEIFSGMTTDVVFNISQKEDVLIIPNRAVTRRNGVSYVRVEKNGSVEERKILTGLRDDAGHIEVMEGLVEGEIVLVD